MTQTPASTAAPDPVPLPFEPAQPGHTAPWFDLWRNPIAQRCRRARLRGRHLLTYGLLGFTVMGFVFLVTYLVPVYQFEQPHRIAAKGAVIPMLVIQGIVMMGMGTMALATGIARERDRDLLDYQRMTPMRPTTKILGYLFGLPAREYFLFALTLPFLLYAVWVADVPLLRLGKYYLVFFSAVWMYHMTGLCAGMVSKRPWQSAVVSLGMVILLYLVLPQLSYVGLSFFQHLTVYPTFVNMFAEELYAETGRGLPEAWMARFQDVPFFETRINAMLFSLGLQSAMLVTLFTAVRRKWIDPSLHSFSKPFGVVLVIGMHVLMLGTLWPTLRDEALLRNLVRELGPPAFALLLGLYMAISTATVGFITYLVTPDRHTARKGFRRARKLGRSSIPTVWDAAPALRWTLAMMAVAVAGYFVLLYAAESNPRLIPDPAPWAWLLAPLAVMIPAVLLFHGLKERFRPRVLALGLFALWIVPGMVAVICGIVTEDPVLSLYVASPSPVVAGGLSLMGINYQAGMFNPNWEDPFRTEVLPSVPGMITFYLVLTSALALGVQASRWRWLRRWHAAETLGPPQTASKAPDVNPGPAPH